MYGLVQKCALLTISVLCKMNPPPAEWFTPQENPKEKPKENPKVSTSTRSKPDWLRMLEVYGFLFDAHARETKPYK